MSITRAITLWCDHDDCGSWESTSGTATRLRRELATRGWTYRSGKDLCPKHRPKDAPAPRTRPTEPYIGD